MQVTGIYSSHFGDLKQATAKVYFSSRKTLTSSPVLICFFQPKKSNILKMSRREITYKSGIDYQLKSDRLIILPQNSSISFKKLSELYIKKGGPNSIPYKAGDPNTSLYWSEGHFFHDQQAEITYTHKCKWDGYMPYYAGDKLTRTISKLKNGKSFKICISGDSISVGYNASCFTIAPPYMPSYCGLVEKGLERAYKSNVTVKNFAVSGWRADEGAKQAPKVAAEKPDPVIIAYGMNDVSQQNALRYKKNVAHIIRTVSKKNPDAEFVLVSTMIGNTQWHNLPADEFGRYRDALRELTGREIVLADMTALTFDILLFKSFYDITGNGVNHPNDFGHRLYAQVILALLVSPELVEATID